MRVFPSSSSDDEGMLPVADENMKVSRPNRLNSKVSSDMKVNRKRVRVKRAHRSHASSNRNVASQLNHSLTFEPSFQQPNRPLEKKKVLEVSPENETLNHVSPSHDVNDDGATSSSSEPIAGRVRRRKDRKFRIPLPFLYSFLILDGSNSNQIVSESSSQLATENKSVFSPPSSDEDHRYLCPYPFFSFISVSSQYNASRSNDCYHDCASDSCQNNLHREVTRRHPKDLDHIGQIINFSLGDLVDHQKPVGQKRIAFVGFYNLSPERFFISLALPLGFLVENQALGVDETPLFLFHHLPLLALDELRVYKARTTTGSGHSFSVLSTLHFSLSSLTILGLTSLPIRKAIDSTRISSLLAFFCLTLDESNIFLIQKVLDSTRIYPISILLLDHFLSFLTQIELNSSTNCGNHLLSSLLLNYSFQSTGGFIWCDNLSLTLALIEHQHQKVITACDKKCLKFILIGQTFITHRDSCDFTFSSSSFALVERDCVPKLYQNSSHGRFVPVASRSFCFSVGGDGINCNSSPQLHLETLFSISSTEKYLCRTNSFRRGNGKRRNCYLLCLGPISVSFCDGIRTKNSRKLTLIECCKSVPIEFCNFPVQNRRDSCSPVHRKLLLKSHRFNIHGPNISISSSLLDNFHSGYAHYCSRFLLLRSRNSLSNSLPLLKASSALWPVFFGSFSITLPYYIHHFLVESYSSSCLLPSFPVVRDHLSEVKQPKSDLVKVLTSIINCIALHSIRLVKIFGKSSYHISSFSSSLFTQLFEYFIDFCSITHRVNNLVDRLSFSVQSSLSIGSDKISAKIPSPQSNADFFPTIGDLLGLKSSIRHIIICASRTSAQLSSVINRYSSGIMSSHSSLDMSVQGTDLSFGDLIKLILRKKNRQALFRMLPSFDFHGFAEQKIASASMLALDEQFLCGLCGHYVRGFSNCINCDTPYCSACIQHLADFRSHIALSSSLISTGDFVCISCLPKRQGGQLGSPPAHYLTIYQNAKFYCTHENCLAMLKYSEYEEHVASCQRGQIMDPPDFGLLIIHNQDHPDLLDYIINSQNFYERMQSTPAPSPSPSIELIPSLPAIPVMLNRAQSDFLNPRTEGISSQYSASRLEKNVGPIVASEWDQPHVPDPSLSVSPTDDRMFEASRQQQREELLQSAESSNSQSEHEVSDSTLARQEERRREFDEFLERHHPFSQDSGATTGPSTGASSPNVSVSIQPEASSSTQAHDTASSQSTSAQPEPQASSSSNQRPIEMPSYYDTLKVTTDGWPPKIYVEQPPKEVQEARERVQRQYQQDIQKYLVDKELPPNICLPDPTLSELRRKQEYALSNFKIPKIPKPPAIGRASRRPNAASTRDPPIVARSAISRPRLPTPSPSRQPSRPPSRASTSSNSSNDANGIPYVRPADRFINRALNLQPIKRRIPIPEHFIRIKVRDYLTPTQKNNLKKYYQELQIDPPSDSNNDGFCLDSKAVRERTRSWSSRPKFETPPLPEWMEEVIKSKLDDRFPVNSVLAFHTECVRVHDPLRDQGVERAVWIAIQKFDLETVFETFIKCQQADLIDDYFRFHGINWDDIKHGLTRRSSLRIIVEYFAAA